MVMHARSGGTLEVMGLLLGKIDANSMIVMDAFALPVEGTETRVNAQAQAYEYMTAYIEAAKEVRHKEVIPSTLMSHFLVEGGRVSSVNNRARHCYK
jgi:Mov34/MPN/PAD-1 family.